jgi:hypothetical protein
MGDAPLPISRVDRIVDGPEVGEQDTVESFGEELLQDRTASTVFNRVTAIAIIRETPQATSLSVHPPAGLVGVEVSGLLRLFRDLLLPGK